MLTGNVAKELNATKKTQFYLKDPSVGKTHTLYEKHASSIATMSMKHKKRWYFESDDNTYFAHSIPD